MVKQPGNPKGPISQALSNGSEEELDPIEALASLISLKGSVELSQFLDQVEPNPSVAPSHPASVLALSAQGVEDVRSRLEFSFENAFRPRFRLTSAQRAWQILTQAGLVGTDTTMKGRQRSSSLRTSARMIWGPFGEFLETRLKRSRFALIELRSELGPSVRGLGQEAAKLESIDTALRQATSEGTQALIRRIHNAFESKFHDALKRSLRELPNAADSEGFELGFNQNGWLGELFRDAQELVTAIVEYEIGQIENLVTNAVDLYEDRQA